MRLRYWIGLDVGERNTVVCAIDSHGHTALDTECASDAKLLAPLIKQLGRKKLEGVALEASGSDNLSRQLRKAGLPIVLVDPGKVHKFLSLRLHKTDKNDARGLAEALKAGDPSRFAVYEKGRVCRDIRDRLALRHQLIQQRTRARNILRSTLRKRGSQLQRLFAASRLRAQVEDELKAISKTDGSDIANSIRPILDLIEAQERYIAQLSAELRQTLDAIPAAQRLTQVPGIGPICALSFYSLIEDPHRFSRSSDVAAYIGLVPRLKQSGTSLCRSRISRTGNSLTRCHLTLAARTLLGRVSAPCALQDWGRGLASRIGHGRARVAVARKLAVVMLAIWKSNTQFEPYPGEIAATSAGPV